MSKTMLPSCIVYNSPYSSPSRGLDHYGAADKRASTMPSQGSLFTNFEDVQVGVADSFLLLYTLRNTLNDKMTQTYVSYTVCRRFFLRYLVL